MMSKSLSPMIYVASALHTLVNSAGDGYSSSNVRVIASVHDGSVGWRQLRTRVACPLSFRGCLWTLLGSYALEHGDA